LTLPPVSTMKGTRCAGLRIWRSWSPRTPPPPPPAWCPPQRGRAASCRGTPRPRPGPTACHPCAPLMSPRHWSAAPCGFSTLGSIVAWTFGNRRSSLHSASRMMSWRFVARFHRAAVQAVQRLLGECPCREIGAVGLSDPFYELAVAWPSVCGAVVPPLRERHGAGDSHAWAEDVAVPVSWYLGPGSWGLSGRPRLSSRTTTRGRGQRGAELY
jgi:hypothetical protein